MKVKVSIVRTDPFTANNQALVYDADGNLSFDGIWTYQWDGENRLTTMTMTNVAGIADTNQLKLDFAYDYMGRRVQKTVYQWNGSGFGTNPVSQVRFVYDGWNLLAEVATNSAAVRSYMWGNDLGGELQSAGGVGGLLMASISGTNCFATYDGNGNITALINAADKSLAARYEYSPYGELLRETGLLARQNPFRFSTKFWDDESGLIYNNFRYYSPSLGRWISRDLTGEKGGINLFTFGVNSPLNAFDSDGDKPGAFTVFCAVVKAAWQLEANNMEGGCAEVPAMVEQEMVERMENMKVVQMTKSRAVASGEAGGGVVVGIVIQVAIVETDTAVLAAVSYTEVEMGAMSASPIFADLGGFFRGLNGGDEAEGDLDATMAALQIGGYTDSGALASWGTLQEIGDSLQ